VSEFSTSAIVSGTFLKWPMIKRQNLA
jgi:hypothetical protein